MFALPLALLLQAATSAPLTIERLIRVAAGHGARDNPVAVSTDAATAVVWEEMIEGRTTLMLKRLNDSSARMLVGGWGHQFGPSLAVRRDTVWLACYFADVSRKTGDRDIVLFRYSGLFARVIDTTLITRDAPGTPYPVNDASPALLLLPGGSRPMIVYSEGRYHGDRPVERAYDDKDIGLAVIAPGRRVTRGLLTSGRERGQEMSPAAVAWKGPGGVRYLVAYLARRNQEPYSLVLAAYDRAWRRVSRRVMARSPGGIAHPALLSLHGAVYLAWTDNVTTDVSVARLDGSLGIRQTGSLRALLAATDFATYGPAAAGLSGVSLFDDRGRPALSFVATMEYQPAQGSIRQEIFLAVIGSQP